jgi:hypothetical protein
MYGDGGRVKGRVKGVTGNLCDNLQPPRYQNVLGESLDFTEASNVSPLENARAQSCSPGAAGYGKDKIVEGIIEGACPTVECDEYTSLQYEDWNFGSHDLDNVYDVGIDLTHCFPFEVTATHAIIDSYHQLQGYPGYKNPLMCKGDHVLSVQGRPTQNMSFLQLSQILCGNIHSAVSMVLGRWDESRNAYSSCFTVSILRHRPQKLVFSAHGHIASRARGNEHGRDKEQEADAKRTWAEILEAKMQQENPVLHASSGKRESFVQEFVHEGSRVIHVDRVGDDSIVRSVDSSGQSLEWSLHGRGAHELEAKGAELRERTLTTSPPSSPVEEALKKASGLHRGKAREAGAGQEEQEGVSTPPQVFAQQADRLDRLSLVVLS